MGKMAGLATRGAFFFFVYTRFHKRLSYVTHKEDYIRKSCGLVGAHYGGSFDKNWDSGAG